MVLELGVSGRGGDEENVLGGRDVVECSGREDGARRAKVRLGCFVSIVSVCECRKLGTSCSPSCVQGFILSPS